MNVKVGEVYLEDCGCKWRVMAIKKDAIEVQHVQDGDILDWDREQFEDFIKTGHLEKI